MNENTKEKIKFITKTYVFPYFLLLTLFALFAFIVLTLRMLRTENYIMQDLTGKYFINIYNDLKQYNLNIEIRKVTILEKPEGIILQQSILPGEVVKPKDKLVLVINNYEPFLKMPDVTNLTLNNAKEILSSMPYEDNVYSLNITKILYVYQSNSTDQVLYQFPAPNTKIKINERIVLIVSTNQPSPINTIELKDLNIGVVSQYLMLQNQPYIIKELIKTKQNDLHGKVQEINYQSKIYELKVNIYNKKKQFYSDFELYKVKFSRKGECSVYLTKEDTSNIEEIKSSLKIWFSKPEIFSEKSFPLVFYRSNKSYLYLICDDKIIDKEFFEPDFYV